MDDKEKAKKLGMSLAQFVEVRAADFALFGYDSSKVLDNAEYVDKILEEEARSKLDG